MHKLFNHDPMGAIASAPQPSMPKFPLDLLPEVSGGLPGTGLHIASQNGGSPPSAVLRLNPCPKAHCTCTCLHSHFKPMVTSALVISTHPEVGITSRTLSEYENIRATDGSQVYGSLL